MTLTLSRVANLGAAAIAESFEAYHEEFKAITARARRRFEAAEWAELQGDAAKRLGLYRRTIDRLLVELRALLDERFEDPLVWMSMKAVYSGRIHDRPDWELAETFFNSVTRRVFTTVGVNEDIEFVAPDHDEIAAASGVPFAVRHSVDSSLGDAVRGIIDEAGFGVRFVHLDADVAAVEERLMDALGDREVNFFEMVPAPFFRNKGAYLVGRAVAGSVRSPFVLALANRDTGLVIDAVLLEEADVSILFSYTRAYFHVESARPADLVRFLKSLMPRKRIAEIYIAIGHNKHGKTELFRDLLAHIRGASAKFEHAPGVPGLVMVAFTLPGYDMVFKVIRDRFPYPKSTTRRAVMDKYHLVFKHDRAGRLIDAQEFEHLTIDVARFAPALLDELVSEASRSISVEGDQVVLHHAYLERKVTPLDLYVRTVPEVEAIRAVRDYGQAIKDLASTNIFPGDMLLKNFGVTRLGRVVFYDYDELALLDEMNFRSLPSTDDPIEEMSDEPWFGVGEHDVFPEQLGAFLGLPPVLREAFMDAHGDLLTPDGWAVYQRRLAKGEIMEVYPYAADRRLVATGGRFAA